MQTEGRARLNVASYAAITSDPLLRKAIELNAFEEGRHKRVLSNLVKAYGIELAPEPQYRAPRDPEWAFMVTGYSECIDSFFAFGLFESAKGSGFFPRGLVDTFEPVMQEEARHILFFVNWAAWHRRTMPWWRRPWFELKVLRRMDVARLGAHRRRPRHRPAACRTTISPSPGQSRSVPRSAPAGLIELCLAENERRMSAYDERLVRPAAVPALARLARRFMRAPRGAPRR